ncbi:MULTISPECIES: acyl-CoA desaturase [unclassified Bradyrhizobium]
MTMAAIVLAPICFSWSAFTLFLAASAITLCAGHSVGMHRKLIHASFDCPLWLEHLFVYLGTLVGMAGPFGMIRLHDFRDWAQRQGACHDYSRHHAGFWRDAWWQLHCRLVLRHPPDFRLEPRLAGDRFYAFVERTWMLQQLPWALLFFAIGGMDWLVWASACASASASPELAGRPLLPHQRRANLDHRWRRRPGLHCPPRRADQHGRELAQQPSCLSGLGEDGAVAGTGRSRLVADPALEAVGLVWNVRTPHNLPERPGLRRLTEATFTGLVEPSQELIGR